MCIERLPLQRFLIWTLVAAVLFLFIWQAWEVLMFGFGALLFAVFLNAITDWVLMHTRLKRSASYALVVIGLFIVIGLGIWQLAPRTIDQLSQIVSVIPNVLARVRENLSHYDWGRELTSIAGRMFGNLNVGRRIASMLGGASDLISGLVVAIVIGFFLALEPSFYSSAIFSLFPDGPRQRAREIFDRLEYTLRWWLLGQILVMIVLGIATMIGLWILHIPLAFTLGLLTGIMVFIPYLGAWLAAIPTALVGLLQGTSGMIEVLVLYLGLHILEGYILTPLMQRRTVRLPPALTLFAQLFLWYLMGLIGVTLATPLTACGLVLVKMLYPPRKAAA